jgi:hypothetical protein
MTRQFKIGRTYSARSICDYDTIFRFKIVGRTAKTITIEQHGETRRRGVYLYDGVEHCKPYGTYSMCPVIDASGPR